MRPDFAFYTPRLMPTSTFTLRATPLDLDFAHPFGIARWTRTATANVLVEVEAEGVVGRGEGAPNARYGESQDDALATIARLRLDRPATREQVVACIDAMALQTSGQNSARAAVDAALWDWLGKQVDKPAWALLGLPRPRPTPTSYTIGIDTPEVIARKIREAPGVDVLKIKLGTDDDRALLRAVRTATDLPIRVDANEGWADRETALRRIMWLAEEGVELVEQPVPAGRYDDVAWLRERSPLPLVADEDCGGLEDIARLAGVYDGVNLKLDKSGGLLEASRMAQAAVRHGLRVMVGCMASSSLATTAAFHLAGAAEWLDLDGHLLLADDPFEGVELEDGRLVLPDRPGLGVRPRRD